jgi:hypothetical protein
MVWSNTAANTACTVDIVCRPCCNGRLVDDYREVFLRSKTTADVIRDDDDQLPQWLGQISSLVA